jgi:hypothetical protein
MGTTRTAEAVKKSRTAAEHISADYPVAYLLEHLMGLS